MSGFRSLASRGAGAVRPLHPSDSPGRPARRERSPTPWLRLGVRMVRPPTCLWRPQWTALKSPAEIEALKGVFADAGAVVVTYNLGLTVAEMTDLRAPPPQGRRRAEGGEEHPGHQGAGRVHRRGRRRPLQGPGRHRLRARTPSPPPRSPPSTPRATTSSKMVGAVMGTAVLDAKGVGALGHPAVAGPDPRAAHRPAQRCRRPRSRACCRRRPASWPGCSTPTPPRTAA